MTTGVATPSIAERIADLQRRHDSLPDARDMPTLRQAEEVDERRMLLFRCLNAARQAKDALDKNVGAIAALTSDRDDLTAIREELCNELLNGPQRSRNRAEMDVIAGLKVSIRMIDGRFDYANDPMPMIVPLFEKLKAKGYTAPPTQPWNTMSALFGSLPTIEARLAVLVKQRDEATYMLESALSNSL